MPDKAVIQKSPQGFLKCLKRPQIFQFNMDFSEVLSIDCSCSSDDYCSVLQHPHFYVHKDLKDMNSCFCLILKVSLKTFEWEVGFHIFSLVSFWYLLMVFHGSGYRVHIHIQRQLLSLMHSQGNRWYWMSMRATTVFPFTTLDLSLLLLHLGHAVVDAMFTMITVSELCWCYACMHYQTAFPCFIHLKKK